MKVAEELSSSGQQPERRPLLAESLLSDPRFYQLLPRFDEDLAQEARKRGCPCGGRLHWAVYPRKPRGIPRDVEAAYRRRASFCCSRKGVCRRRTTPPSLRFLGRRVYVSVVVVLISAMREGITERRAAGLRAHVDIGVRTLRRWRSWWLETFPHTPFWKAASGRVLPPVDLKDIPASLLKRFTGSSPGDRLIRLLQFLGPLTAGSRWAMAP